MAKAQDYRQEERCPTCLGMGYKGRWRTTARGRAWKIETCRRCEGSGQCLVRRRGRA